MQTMTQLWRIGKCLPLCALAGMSALLFAGCAGIQYTDNAPGEDLRAAASKSSTVTVLAKAEGWRSAGVQVEPGNDYVVSATGIWRVGPVFCPYTGPEGGGGVGGLIPGVSFGTLIAKIGESGQPFSVGSRYNLHPSQVGSLYFRINDGLGLCGDNDGQMQVTTTLISRGPAAGESPQPTAKLRTRTPAPAARPKNSQSWR